MPNWLVRLTGEVLDLEYLVRETASSAPPCVVKDQGGYYLRSPQFSAITDDVHEVCACAQRALQLLIGLARLQRSDIRPVEILAIAREEPDRPPTQFVLPDSIVVRISLYRDLANGHRHGGLDGRLPFALKEELVTEAIHHLGSQEPTWWRLRKVYEIVKQNVGGWKKIAEYGWATEQELDRFWSSANNPKASGHEALHAFPRGDPVGLPMSAEEGGALIYRIVAKWIDWRRSAGG